MPPSLLLFAAIAGALLCCNILHAARPHRPFPSPALACPTNAYTRNSPAVVRDHQQHQAVQEAAGFCSNLANCCEKQVLAAKFQEMVVHIHSSDTCIAALKSLLCARCTPVSLDAQPAQAGEPITALPASCHRRGAPPYLPAICLERIAGAGPGGPYTAMVPHPDGSNRVFLIDKVGRIWLQTIPDHGSGGTLDDEEVTIFLDLTDRVPRRGAGHGVMGVAFHHEFATNARFFVSYIDSRAPNPQDVGCDLARPCPYQLVVSEFTAEAPAAPSETRRIFTMGLTQLERSARNHPAGQLLFRSDDNERLYLVTGHGYGRQGSAAPTDPSQDDKWKIVMLNINHKYNPSGQGGKLSSRNNSIAEKKPDLFAMGLGNPRGCSFDDSRGLHHLYCASVNKDQYERVDLIRRGGNYGTSSATPFIGYGRPTVSRSPSIIGGLVYRGSMDPSLNGKYIYYYGSTLWIGTPNSRDGRYAAARMALTKCSTGTPVPMSCGSGGAHRAISGRVLTFGEDNSKDAFVLATGGVYRVVHSGLCGSGTEAGGGADYGTLSLGQPSTASWPAWLLSVVVFHAIIWWWYIKQFCSSPTNACTGSEQAGTTTTHSGSRYYIQCCMSWMCCNGTTRSGQAQALCIYN